MSDDGVIVTDNLSFHGLVENPETNFLNKDIIINGVIEAGRFNITWSNIIILIIFIGASITDAIDGHIARSRNLVTDFGKFLDPLADKLLVTCAMLVLMEEGRLWGWVVALILAREFAITGLRSVAAANGTVIAASKYGKLKTITQMVMIIVLLVNNFPFSIIYIHTGVYIPFDLILVCLATLLTIISGVDYFIKNKESIERFSKKFFDLEEAFFIPGAADLNGNVMGGWVQYTYSIGSSIWMVLVLEQWYSFTKDEDYKKSFLLPILQKTYSVLRERFLVNVGGRYEII